VLGATGREHQSETNHLDAIRLSIKASGERNADVGVFVRDLAALYTKQGRAGEADDLYRRSISILREGLGESSHQLSKTYRAYSAMLSAAGRSREAAEYRPDSESHVASRRSPVWRSHQRAVDLDLLSVAQDRQLQVAARYRVLRTCSLRIATTATGWQWRKCACRSAAGSIRLSPRSE